MSIPSVERVWALRQAFRAKMKVGVARDGWADNSISERIVAQYVLAAATLEAGSDVASSVDTVAAKALG